MNAATAAGVEAATATGGELPTAIDGDGTEVEIAVVGSGFAGIGMAIALLGAGRRDFLVLERADDVGGTWRDNTYPGAACDVPSHVYSFSFAPNPRWSSSFSGQAEILGYLRDCAERFGVRPYIRFGHEVTAARWDDGRSRWVITTSAGTVTARYLVAGMGPLSEPSLPDVAGLSEFAGPVWHSARWDHDADLDGARVAVVGTGASAVQLVPEIQPKVAHLDLYQRTPPWVLPRHDRPLRDWERRLFRLAPPVQLAVRAGIYWARELSYLTFTSWARNHNPAEKAARAHLAAQVGDPDLRRRLTPSYAMGCKRILLSDDYYPALCAPNVTVVDGGLAGVTPSGLVAADGATRAADAIIFATGFHATDPPAARLIFGRGGVRLSDRWAGGMVAHKGTTVAGFPNLFYLVGPNTGLGHNSMVYMIESQIRYVLAALRAAGAASATELDVRPDAQGAWNTRLQRNLARTVWTTGGCVSWYLDPSGHNTTLWPGFSFRYRHAVRRFDAEAYELGRGRRPGGHSGAGLIGAAPPPGAPAS